MKPGKLVTIYRDPLKKVDEEGKAILIELDTDAGKNLEYWVIHFVHDKDNHNYIRAIYTK